MKITLFSSLYTKEAADVIELRQWVEAIRDGKYRQQVEKIRYYVQQGLKDDASNIKLKLPAVVTAGVCRKGRYYKYTTERTGYMILDIDNLLPEQLKAARGLLEVFPWVVMLHVTSSGRGLRILVNGGIVHIDIYRNAYEKVAARLRELTGLEPDMACRDFARASLASYDPDIYFNPDATVFDYGDDSNPLNYVPATGPDTSEDFRFVQNPVTQALALGADADRSAAPDIDSVLDRFFSTHTYVQGSRTRTMLRLGGYLRWYRVQSWQLDEAIYKACARGVEPGITAKEIERAVRWGYEHGNEGGNNGFNQVRRVQQHNISTFPGNNTEQNPNNEDKKEEEQDEDEVIKEHCGPIPDPVFETLPASLSNLLSIAKDKRERDVILLSCITILSGLFPALRTMYGNRKYSAHLYMCFLAGAGAGKGVATHATLLGNPIHRELVKRNKIARREYENRLIEWELEVRQASKEKRKPDMELRPQETERDVLYLQANTSKSQMMHEMSGSSAHGNILYITEIDAFSEALQTDYGKHAAEIRMIFHHEKIGQSFKTDKEPIEIESPRLSLMMTGTPQQLVNFIKTLEDGLFSRFLFYVMSTSYKWISQSPLDGNGSIDVNELFSPLAAQLKENFFNSLDKEIMIHFTRTQWDRHSETFQAHLGMVSAESDSAAYGIIFRAGLIVLRVAMVFCGLRILEAGWQVAEYTCTDEDFDAAMDIVLTCMSHTMNTSTMFNEAAKRHKLTNYYKLLPVLKKMNDRFKYSEFKTGANGLGIGDSSVKRALKKYIVTGLITKENDGYRKTDLAKKCI